nr:hypothetical protein [Tanacetum cinerariifolium]
MPVQCPSKIKQHKPLDVTISIPRSILTIRTLASPLAVQLSSAAHAVLTTRPACRSSLVSCLPSLGESLPSVLDAYAVSGAESHVHTPAPGGSEAQNGLPNSIISSGGMCRGGGSGGDGNAAGAVHLARHSPAEGGDSEVSGDGDRVGMARSLSTSVSGGKDMAA